MSLLTVFLILIPAALYILGMLEGKWGRYLFIAAIFLHMASIAQRWAVVGNIPLSSKHDNISFMALSMALAYLYFSRKGRIPGVATIALPVITALMFTSLAFKPVDTISPFFRTQWFYLHMFFYFASYGFMGLSACIGIYYLIKREPQYESLQYRGMMYGWVLFTLSLVFGSIWFFVSYGTYWLWTSREMWMTLVWFYLGIYMHTRYLKPFMGRPAAVLGVAGFAVALFAYFGLNTVIPSPPTQF